MIEELNEHLEAIKIWIEREGNTRAPAPGLSSEERKQLQAVNKATAQLTRLGVPIPEDLRNLKLRLSAKDAPGEANPEVEERIAALEKLIDQLRKLALAARTLRDSLKENGQPGGTKKHYGVSLMELVRHGYLSPEDRLEFQWLRAGPTYEGKVEPDGSVMVKTQAGWNRYESLSTAATDISKRSLNGWQHWRRINTDGSSMPLKEIRSQYMSKGAKP